MLANSFTPLKVMTFLCCLPLFCFAQYSIKGNLIDSATKIAANGVVVSLADTDFFTVSDEKGTFELFGVPEGAYVLHFSAEQYVLLKMDITVKGQNLNLKDIELVVREESAELDNREEFIPTITLSDEDLEQDIDNQNISGILSASRDVFISAAAFTFGPMRFRIRGYDSENTEILINNIPMNDLESGRIFWSAWGGLNDVTRNRDTDIGLGAIPYTFGSIGGATAFDTRASVQRKQVRVSTSLSNRAYRYRWMATYSTGVLPSGWAFSFSGSRRWADEGYIPGTFYDAYAYFLSVDRKLGKDHELNLTAFGTPSRRGRSGASVQEMYDLATTNYYNPYWGFQNGEKRNSRVADRHEPMFILRHDWAINSRANLITSVAYQFGHNGSTALDWFDVNDPRPDYYRDLPSFFLGDGREEAAALRLAQLNSGEENRQIKWDELYDINRNSLLTTKFAGLLTDQTFQGKWSQSIIEDRRYDNTRFNFYSNYQHVLSDELTVYFGASYQRQKVDSYKLVEDLLGGDFYVNVDKFILGDSTASSQAVQYDLENSDNILGEGDRWGYNYESHIHKGKGWLQMLLTLRKIDAFLGANFSNTQFWRVGKFRNGSFPSSSLGKSEVESFSNFGLKGGLTYKINGRQYFYANGLYTTRAPFMRNAYVSPRTRDQIVPGLTSETIYSGEAGYILRSPNAKARATAYYSRFQDQVEIVRFYNDLNREFGNYVMSGVGQRHVGAELAIETKLNPIWSLSAVAALGEYVFDERSTGNIYLDDEETLTQGSRSFTIYSKDFYVSGTPQQAYTFGINYRSPNYWFANLNFNYFDIIWIDFSPVRQTVEAVINLEPESDQFRQIIAQENTGGAFTVDFFGGASFKMGKHFIYVNAGVNNILDKQDFRTGGYEQLRFDVRDRDVNAFPSKYYYSYGLNYFVNVSYRY